MNPSFFILSLSHSEGQSTCVWWKSGAKGYTESLESAGIFSWDTVKGNPAYYDNGVSTRAIPVDEVLAASIQVVEYPFAPVDSVLSQS